MRRSVAYNYLSSPQRPWNHFCPPRLRPSPLWSPTSLRQVALVPSILGYFEVRFSCAEANFRLQRPRRCSSPASRPTLPRQPRCFACVVITCWNINNLCRLTMLRPLLINRYSELHVSDPHLTVPFVGRGQCPSEYDPGFSPRGIRMRRC